MRRAQPCRLDRPFGLQAEALVADPADDAFHRLMTRKIDGQPLADLRGKHMRDCPPTPVSGNNIAQGHIEAAEAVARIPSPVATGAVGAFRLKPLRRYRPRRARHGRPNSSAACHPRQAVIVVPSPRITKEGKFSYSAHVDFGDFATDRAGSIDMLRIRSI